MNTKARHTVGVLRGSMGFVRGIPAGGRLFAALVCIFAVSLAIRLVGIGQESFFLDEGITANACQEPLIYHVTEKEATPPVYFALIKAWAVVFGTGYSALRVPSAFAGALLPVLLFLVARALGLGRLARVFAWLLPAILPICLWYGQQARCYTLLLVWIALYFLALVHCLRGPSRIWEALVAGCLFLGFATHYHFAFAMAGPVVWVGATAAFSWRRQPELRRLFGAHAVGLGLCLLLLPLLYYQAKSGIVDWIPRPRLRDLTGVFTRAFVTGPFQSSSRPVQHLIGGAFALFALAGALRAAFDMRRGRSPAIRQRGWWIFFWMSAAAIPVVLPYALSRNGMSFFLMDRYTIVALPAFLLFLIHTADTAFSRWGRVGALALLAIVFLPLAIRSDYRYYTELQEFDWRGAARIVDSEQEAGDGLVFFPNYLVGTYRINGGQTHRETPTSGVARVLERSEGRVWLFEWLGNPSQKERELAKRLRKWGNASIRTDSPHIKMWEIVRAGG